MQGDDRDLSRLVAYLETLGRLGNSQTVPELLRALCHKEPVVRQVAATALGRIADDGAVLGLLESLRDSSPNVRQAAAWSLGQIGDGQAVGGLLSALHDPHTDTRRAAIWALGSLGDLCALPGIQAAQHDPDESVCRAAAGVIETLAGAPQLHETAASIEPSPTPLPVREIPERISMASSRRHQGRWIAFGLIVPVIVATLLMAALSWNRSLGPELVTLDASMGFPTSEPIPALSGEPICGGPPVMMLLLVGNDAASSDASIGFADVIRIARIDFIARSVVLLAIPRDLWIPIPGLEAHGISSNRVKTAYTYGEHYAVPGGGPSLLAQTLALNFGLHADHYVVITFAAFEEGIDTLGGIDVYLPRPVESDTPGGLGFPAGWQHMDGRMALAYARFRPDNSSDLARIDRQTQVISALRDQVFGAQAMAALPDLVLSLRESALTDLSPADISSLTCLGRQLAPDDIQTVTIEGDRMISVTDEYGYERLLPNSEAIRQFVRAFNLGQLAP